MVKYYEQSLDKVFSALADPTRRALLARLQAHNDLSISELAKPFPVTMPAILKHLAVLSDAGLVERRKTGRTVACHLTAAPMEEAMNWLTRYQRFWTRQLDRLAAIVEEDPCPPARNPQQGPSSPASPSNVVSLRRRKRSTPRGRSPRS